MDVVRRGPRVVLAGLGVIGWGPACSVETDLGVVTGSGDGEIATGETGEVGEPLDVSEPDTVINDYRALAVDADRVASLTVVTELEGWAVGDRVMVWQTATADPLTTTADDEVDAVSGSLGAWELSRIAAVDGVRLQLEAPLEGRYVAPGAQVVRAPEWSSVRIAEGASVVARPWDGQRGGIVVLLAADDVVGRVSADGAGFRGGAHADANTGAVGFCEDDDDAGVRGAYKGEGIATATFAAGGQGRGFVANGGGGGVCWRAGGGGGAGGGRGGVGGRSSNWDNSRADAGGQGGRALARPAGRLMLGGGGGGGHGAGDEAIRDGGAGGGVVFVSAASFEGTVSASGLDAPEARNDGAAGGGGGGTIHLGVTAGATCQSARAAGGAGGNVFVSDTAAYGPGGGGGGGFAILLGAPECTADVSGGSHGWLMGDRQYGAEDGLGGVIER